MTPWKDIADAPKDGTVIDLWVIEKVANSKTGAVKTNGFRCEDAWWGEPYGDYFGNGGKLEPQWCQDGDVYGEHWVDPVEKTTTYGLNNEITETTVATHWMPLPPPPTGQEP